MKLNRPDEGWGATALAFLGYVVVMAMWSVLLGFMFGWF